MFLPTEYKSKKKKIFLENKVRNKIFYNCNSNLHFLLKKRFKWMEKYTNKKNNKIIVELGSGSGCIKKIIKKDKILLTDIVKYKWIDQKIDMLKINLDKKYHSKVDIFIINHALHHCPNPVKCLKLLQKYLKDGGLILINEPETSFFLKLIQIITDDEGWSYKKNIFDSKKNFFKTNDPWFSNTATGELLFKDQKKFEKNFPGLKFLKNELSEFFIFINSGGVNSDIPNIPFNKFFLNILDKVDNFFVKVLPNIFALNRSVVLQKFKNNED
jgi:SAM-dependent methyltransferase